VQTLQLCLLCPRGKVKISARSTDPWRHLKIESLTLNLSIKNCIYIFFISRLNKLIFCHITCLQNFHRAPLIKNLTYFHHLIIHSTADRLLYLFSSWSSVDERMSSMAWNTFLPGWPAKINYPEVFNAAITLIEIPT